MSGAKEALTHHDWCYCYAALIRRNFAGITHLNTSTKSNAGTILSSNMQVYSRPTFFLSTNNQKYTTGTSPSDQPTKNILLEKDLLLEQT
jgi:hypothetical protein